MAKLLPPYTLCPIIDTKKLLGVAEDKDPGCVIVTLGRNMVSRYKLSDQKQVQSWTFQKKLSSPVVYDHSSNSYVGVFDHCFVGTWTDGLTQSDKLDKHWFVWMIQSILASEDGPALLVYENGIIGSLEKELPHRKLSERVGQTPPLTSQEKIVESKLVSLFGHDYVYLHVTSKNNDKIRVLLRPVDKGEGSEIAFEVDQKDFNVSAMTILSGTSPYLVTLRSNASVYITHLTGAESVNNSSDLTSRLVTTLDLINCDLPSSILTLDTDRLLMYGSAVNSEGAILAVVSLKYGLTEAKQRMKVYEPAACRMWLCREHVVVVNGTHLVVVPFQMNAARLVSLIGKRKKGEESSEDFTRSRVNSHSFDDIMEHKDLKGALALFDNVDLPDDWILSVLVLALNENESDARKELIHKILSYSLVGDNTTLKEMRAKIDLDCALKLLDILTDEVESSDENKCLFDWACLLLDSHFPQYLLSKDMNVLRSVRTLFDTVASKLQRVKTYSTLLADINFWKKGKSETVKTVRPSVGYTVEKIKLY